MFSKKERSKEEINFGFFLLVSAPCFIYFYVDRFWDALPLLCSISIFGGLLAKYFEKKARYSLPVKDIYLSMVSWLILFSIGYGGLCLWEYLSNYFYPQTAIYSTEPVTDIPMKEGFFVSTDWTVESLFPSFSSSFYFLLSMAFLFSFRLYEIKYPTKKINTTDLLMLVSIAAGILPLLSDQYVLSLIINFYILAGLGSKILVYKEESSSAGAIGIIYAFTFMFAASFGFMIKAVNWLLSF